MHKQSSTVLLTDAASRILGEYKRLRRTKRLYKQRQRAFLRAVEKAEQRLAAMEEKGELDAKVVHPVLYALQAAKDCLPYKLLEDITDRQLASVRRLFFPLFLSFLSPSAFYLKFCRAFLEHHYRILEDYRNSAEWLHTSNVALKEAEVKLRSMNAPFLSDIANRLAEIGDEVRYYRRRFEEVVKDERRMVQEIKSLMGLKAKRGLLYVVQERLMRYGNHNEVD